MEVNATNKRTEKRARLQSDRRHSILKGRTSNPIKGSARPIVQALDVRTDAMAAGTCTATVTLVAAAPAAMVCGEIVIVEPAGPPLAESVTAGSTAPVEGAMVRL